MMMKVAYSSLHFLVGVSTLVGWMLSRTAKLPELATWRRCALRLGLVGNTGSLLLFLATIFQIIGMRSSIVITGVAFLLTFTPILLGAFGQRIPRVLVILNSLVLAFLWLDLGASSL
jgi:hypothetical protein